MFILNGIVYGGQPTEILSIKSAKCLPDKIMLITFSTGETRLFDASILQGEIFAPLEDKNVFESAYIDHGVVTWLDGAIDCAPEFMYQNIYKYDTIEAS